MFRKLSLLVLLFAVAFVQAVPTTYVDSVPDGTTHFATIQEAIDAVDSGGTVNVQSGVYIENIIINKPLSLLGPFANTPGHNARDDEQEAHLAVSDSSNAIITITSGSVSINGLYFYGGDAPFAITNSNLLVHNIAIENNIFADFASDGSGAIRFDGADLTTSSGNIISNNWFFSIASDSTTDAPEYAIGLVNNFFATISDNFFSGVPNAIIIESFELNGPAIHISNNDISSAEVGIRDSGNAAPFPNLQISNNHVIGEESGVSVGISLQNLANGRGSTLSNNIIENNLVGIRVVRSIGSGIVSITGGNLENNSYGILSDDADGTPKNTIGIQIDGSTITSNYYGIFSDSETTTFGSVIDSILSNNVWDVYNPGNSILDVSRNYWGSAILNQVTDGIFGQVTMVSYWADIEMTNLICIDENICGGSPPQNFAPQFVSFESTAISDGQIQVLAMFSDENGGADISSVVLSPSSGACVFDDINSAADILEPTVYLAFFDCTGPNGEIASYAITATDSQGETASSSGTFQYPGQTDDGINTAPYYSDYALYEMGDGLMTVASIFGDDDGFQDIINAQISIDNGNCEINSVNSGQSEDGPSSYGAYFDCSGIPESVAHFTVTVTDSQGETASFSNEFIYPGQNLPPEAVGIDFSDFTTLETGWFKTIFLVHDPNGGVDIISSRIETNSGICTLDELNTDVDISDPLLAGAVYDCHGSPWAPPFEVTVYATDSAGNEINSTGTYQIPIRPGDVNLAPTQSDLITGDLASGQFSTVAIVSDPNMGWDIKTATISTSSGTCISDSENYGVVDQLNDHTAFMAGFICSGTPGQTADYDITVTDWAEHQLVISGSNTYPN